MERVKLLTMREGEVNVAVETIIGEVVDTLASIGMKIDVNEKDDQTEVMDVAICPDVENPLHKVIEAITGGNVNIKGDSSEYRKALKSSGEKTSYVETQVFFNVLTSSLFVAKMMKLAMLTMAVGIVSDPTSEDVKRAEKIDPEFVEIIRTLAREKAMNKDGEDERVVH